MYRLYIRIVHQFKINAWLPILLGLFILGMPMMAAAQGDQTFQNGATTPILNFPAGSCVYKWVNSDPSIGLPASGSGYIPSFTATNTGTKAITATIIATPVPSGYAYIPSAGTNQLYVVNTSTNTVESTIDVGNGGGINLSPDQQTLYVANGGGSSISIIDVATNTVTGTQAVGLHPRGLAVSPDGSKVYVANSGSDDVSVFDIQTKQVSNIAVGKGPTGLIISPDGKNVYVTNSNDGTVSVISTASGIVTGTVSVGTSPLGMAIDPAGALLYVADPGAKKIVVVDLQQLSVKTTIPTFGNTQQVVISPDGKLLYYANSDDFILTTLNTTNYSTVKFIPIGQGPSGMSISPNGAFLYIINNNSNDVSVVNTATTFVEATIPVGQFSSALGNFVTGNSCRSISFTITVNPDPPKAVISATSDLTGLNTTYGTPSALTTISVSGTGMTEGILVTPPPGLEVSTDGDTFSETVTVGAAGTIDPTTVYLRIKGTVPVSTFSGDVVLSSAGAGNVTFKTPVNQVTKTALIILAEVAEKTYGSVLTSGPVTTGFTGIGLMNNETIGSVVMTYGDGADALATPNVYSEQAVPSSATGGTFSLDNYQIVSYNANDIAVDPALLTITADDKSKPVGEANPPLTFTFSGFVNGEGPAQLISPPEISTTAVKDSPIGQYPITVSGALGTNYSITYVAGTLNVIPKPVNVNNAFTPNGDGINDTWDIQFLSTYRGCRVQVLNRYGQRVFYSVGYPVAWDGKYNGTNIPSGTYYYIIDLNNGTRPLTGYLAILR